ncbi:multicopper oxidase family protein [Myxococcota bacterium]|nr:multicopper oxidase family protein [Myxococcota bacterium]
MMKRRRLDGARASTLLALGSVAWMASTACMGGMGDMTMMVPDVLALPAWEGTAAPAVATDLDPADGVVEVELEAKVAEVELAEGHRVSMWTYGGVLPGPRIEANAGDTIRVRFTNHLPEATTIHWHGLRVANAMDGVPMLQAPIEPGASFTYELVVPDAGTFWYHPHVRSDEQVERGLYGTIVVRGPNEPETTSDQTIVLDDVLVDPSSWQLAGFDDDMMQVMLGRQGNVILANGRAHPVLDAAPGGLHRFRFVNASNARYFRLALPGEKLTLIATDGGLLAAPREVDALLLVPGERAEVLVAPRASDGAKTWTGLDYDRGHMTSGFPDFPIFVTRPAATATVATPAMPVTLGDVPQLPAAMVMRELVLRESMTMSGGHGGHGGGTSTGPTFSINDETYPDATPLEAVLGTVEEWSIVNDSEMDHPFHLHGFRFQIVDEDGAAPAFRAWRDTINVPANETIRIRVPLEDHAGTWMFHCHILEHAERGMAGELEVREP